MMEVKRLTHLFFEAGRINNCLPSEEFKTNDARYPVAGVEFVEALFPSWIVILCKIHHPEVRYVSKNSKSIIGYAPETLMRLTPEEFFSYIHPDDQYSVRMCYEKMCQVMREKEYRPENFKFAFHYRLQIPNKQYIKIVDEKSALINKSGVYLHFSLVKPVSVESSSAYAYMDIHKKDGLKFMLTQCYLPNKTQNSLTTRELEVIQFVKRGLTNKEIAEAMFLSVHTVRNHRASIHRKTQVRNAVELMHITEKIFLS